MWSDCVVLPSPPFCKGSVRTALGNSFEVTRLLIEHDADIEAKDDHGHTALYFAVWKESLRVARLLEDKGASTDGIDLRWMGYLEDG